MKLESYSFLGCLFLLLLIIGIDLLIFLAFMALWNWLVPLFWTNAPILTYWQAAGCVILLEIIGGFFKSRNI